MDKDEAQELIRRLASEGRIGYQCCFCHEEIAGDICSLGITTKWNGLESEQRYQQWPCHADCFTKATSERIDVLDDDSLPT